jgi:catechol 2,3-dioxygenase-like lactoylglutathione lyase family enzyme
MQVPTMGVHHITLVGANRQATIDFYQGVLGMPLVLEQPNLDVPKELHLYFDAGDGRLITFFVREDRQVDHRPVPEAIGSVHHIAYAVSRETFDRAASRLQELGYPNTGPIDRGFMDSLYFRDPNGLRLELATYKFTPPPGRSPADVLAVAHKIRLERGDYNITEEHLRAAIEQLEAAPAASSP